jgi:hypothetical protein
MEAQRVTPGGQTPQHPPAFREEVKGIARYANKVQGLAYGGAAALVVIVGLRSIYGRQIPTPVVIGALVLEALLLIMIATVYYLTPEDKGGSAPSTDSQILSGEKEILHLLKKEVIPGEIEMIKVLKNDISSAQRELISVMRNEVLVSQKEMYSVLRNELVNGEAEALRVLQRIDTNITKIVENEVERIVQSKVQEAFTSLVRQEVQKSLTANTASNA